MSESKLSPPPWDDIPGEPCGMPAHQCNNLRHMEYHARLVAAAKGEGMSADLHGGKIDLTAMRETYEAAAARIVRVHNLHVEELTESQLVEAFTQALISGDFMRQISCFHDGQGGQSVTYRPGEGAARIRRLYDELINDVKSKHEGETRHETALRYIREREQCPCHGSSLNSDTEKQNDG